MIGRQPAARALSDSGLRHAVHERLVASSEVAALAEASPAQLRGRLDDLLHELAPLLTRSHHDLVVEELAAEVTGFGPLEPLLADPDVTEVMVNGPGRVYVERHGCIEAVDGAGLDAAMIRRLVERVIAPLGLRIDLSSPMVDARLADGSRVHAVLPPLALDGPYLTIRRFGARRVELDAFAPGPDAAAFLHWAVAAGWNLVVAGGTSTGKTTLLNALAESIDDRERVVTIEETAELRLAATHVLRLEARPANGEGIGAVTIRDLVRAALRMRPDRLVIGEVRGGEALDLLQALNTGHDGSMTSVHSNGARATLRRLETLASMTEVGLPLDAIRGQLAVAIDGIVAVRRLRGGGRRIESIAEVTDSGGVPAVRPLFVRRSHELVAVQGTRRPPRRSEIAHWEPRSCG